MCECEGDEEDDKSPFNATHMKISFYLTTDMQINK